MPIYSMMCDKCNHTDEFALPMSKSPSGNSKCPECGKKKFHQYWPIGCNVVQSRQFESYVDEDITGKPIEITSPKQRDRVLAEHGCTMDTLSNPKRGGTRDPWENDIPLDKVLDHIEKHGPETPINPEESL